MARIRLQVDDDTLRMTLRALLRAAGHTVSDAAPELAIVGDFEAAAALAPSVPTLTVASVGQIPGAVAAMRRGVYGYIFLPLQPGEAELMVRRALDARTAAMPEPPARTLAQAEQAHIREILRRCRGNRAKAARVLGVGRNTLWRKLKQMGNSAED